jgi:hypothetical protein
MSETVIYKTLAWVFGAFALLSLSLIIAKL